LISLYQHQATEEKRKVKTFRIIGVRYSTEKIFYDWSKEFFYYEKLEEKEFPQMEFESLTHAEKWIAKNHPEYYFGCNIVENKKGGDFSIIPIPSYFESLFNTSDRNFIISEIIKTL
jgi:hypothetical protein